MTEDERDRYLQGALRHAPDAQLGPAPALSDAILKEARAKARDPAPSRLAKRGGLLALWDALARPSVATGFAGVMAAVLVGVMWWGQPMDEALPRRPAPADAPVAAMAPRPSAPDLPGLPPQAAEGALRTPAPKAADAPVDAAARRQEREAAATQSRAVASESKKKAERADSQPPPAPAPSPAAAPKPTPAPPALPPEPAADAAPAATAAAAGDLARPAPAMTAKARAPAPAPGAQRMQESAVAGGRAGNTEGFTAPSAPTEARARSADRAALAGLRAALATEPAAWAWQRGDGPAHSMDEALRGWLSRLDATAGDAWQARTPDTAAPRGRELRLMREGRVVHSLRLTGNAVLWERDGGGPVQAVLPSATLGALQQALDEAAP
jgi:hypothetical protein